MSPRQQPLLAAYQALACNGSRATRQERFAQLASKLQEQLDTAKIISRVRAGLVAGVRLGQGFPLSWCCVGMGNNYTAWHLLVIPFSDMSTPHTQLNCKIPGGFPSSTCLDTAYWMGLGVPDVFLGVPTSFSLQDWQSPLWHSSSLTQMSHSLSHPSSMCPLRNRGPPFLS